ncbi:MAG: hypothetical protein AAGF01_00005 [Cyanobacteria bacterium P01_G01_bin.38]
MPRLIGKQSNSSWYVGLLLIVAIATAGSLEVLGFINVIPGFGWDDRLNDQPQTPFRDW